jgi:hypothetical protein
MAHVTATAFLEPVKLMAGQQENTFQCLVSASVFLRVMVYRYQR